MNTLSGSGKVASKHCCNNSHKQFTVIAGDCYIVFDNTGNS